MEELIQRAKDIMALPNPLSTNYGDIMTIHNELGLEPTAFTHKGCACKAKAYNAPAVVYSRLTDYINNL